MDVVYGRTPFFTSRAVSHEERTVHLAHIALLLGDVRALSATRSVSGDVIRIGTRGSHGCRAVRIARAVRRMTALYTLWLLSSRRGFCIALHQWFASSPVVRFFASGASSSLALRLTSLMRLSHSRCGFSTSGWVCYVYRHWV